MALGAVCASAGTPTVTKGQASAALERPAGARALHDGTGATGSPLPSVPSATAGAPRAPGVAAADVIFYDGFESGALPAWTSSGDPTWGIDDYRSAVGGHSVYCAGDPYYAPGPYANNMNAWLVAGPFNLSELTSGSFDFKLFRDTETDRDYVKAMVSIDDDMYYGSSFTGTQGWTDYSIDLTNVYTLGNVCGRSQVWIALIFQSDSSIVYEGAYVDEVLVSGSSGGGESGMELDAAPLVVPYKGSVDMSVDLLDVGTGFLIPGQDIQWLYCQNDLLPRVWTAGETVSSSTGHYAFTLSNLVRRTYFIMYFAGDSQYTESWSNYVKVMARAKVTPPNVPSRVRAGVRITCWGTIAPQHTAAQNRASHTKVAIQRYTGGRWRALYSLFAQKYRNSGSVTKYSITLMFAPGKWRVNATHSDIDHAKSVSSWRTFTVR
jgi:hypothetical protein